MRRPATAVVLAAGCGSRLGSASGRTKCLTEVGRATLLAHTMGALVGRVERAVLVAGHERDAVADAAVALASDRMPIDVVDNRRFRETGTAESLRLALAAVAVDSDALIIEADVLFEPRILEIVVSSPFPTVTVVDDWRPESSGTVAVVRDSRVIAWVHESRRPAGFSPERHHKTVNITRVGHDVWSSRLTTLLDGVVRELGERSPLEYAFERLVSADPALVHAVPVDGCKWWEVDTPDDLVVARALFAQVVRPSY